MTKRDADSGIRNIDRVLLVLEGVVLLKVAQLALDVKGDASETSCCADLVDVFSSNDCNSKPIGIGEGCAMLIYGSATRIQLNSFDDAICDILGVNLVAK